MKRLERIHGHSI